ncbi:MAG: hypothetical protein Q4G05_00595 [Clostridia bacterium]|nr:hypothetical protein [Clostridia bacterium]
MKEIRRYIIFILLISFILIIFICNSKFTFSKYHKKVFGRGVGEIATPIFLINYGENVNITNEKMENIYYFSVRNFREEQISQVSMKYKIEIQNTLKDIQIRLYKGEEEISLNEGKTDFIQLDTNKKEDKYKMEVIYKGDLQTRQIGKIGLNVYAEQII